MYKKKKSREPANTAAGESCFPVDGDSFIWTSTNTMFTFSRHKIQFKEDEEQRIPKIKNLDNRKQKTYDYRTQQVAEHY